MADKANIGPKIVLEGEAEYKQSINNVNKSMSVLKSELKAVTAEFDGNANSIDALRAKNEVLMKQQSEQERKLSLLRGALQDANRLYGEESVQVQNWQIKLNNAYADLSKLNKEIDKNTINLKEAENSTDKTAKSIDKFGKEVKVAGDNTEKAGKAIKTNLSSAAVIAGVAALGLAMEKVVTKTIDLVKGTASYADGILTLSAQTGVATDKLQELKYMEELTDVSLETVTNSMAKQIKAMFNAQKGTEDVTNAYKKLGVEFKDSNGALKDSDTVYWEAIDALGLMANETERDATAMLLFGKSAQDLNPIIKIGSAGVSEFAKEAQKMGAVLSNDTLISLGKTDDALQRMYLQLDIAKRSIGTDIAPAMTEAFEKITDKVDEVDDKFAEFAEGAIGDVVDGFLWMIDNADLIAAGLKGITAAIITKKAADGIAYAMQAYKTLTTATQAATVAQTAFNVASKANVIGAIASVVIGLGTALYSYAKSADNAADATNKMTKAVNALIEDRKESIKDIEAEYGAINKLSDSLYTLADKENKTNSEKQQMVTLVEQLNEAMPDLNLTINEQTGLLNLQADELDKVIEKQLELNMVIAAQNSLQTIANNKYKAENDLNDLLAKRVELEEKLESAEKRYVNPPAIIGMTLSYKSALRISEKAFKDNEKAIEDTKALVQDLGVEYQNTMNYIGDHSAIDETTRSLDGFFKKYEDTLNQENSSYEDGLKDRLDAIGDTYKASEKALDKSLKSEQKALDKAQKKQIESVEKASDEELKILEEQHKDKLALIDEEYLEKMKLVNEDRYKELKKIQDQIDGIETQSEAEERASKLKEEATERAELNAQIASATTAEQKLEAQQELADFEEEVAKDRLRTERNLQKDILKEQKDTINDAYDEKIDALEKAQKKEEEKSDLIYENEKLAIAERKASKIQEIEDIQELETQALQDKQDDVKTQLDNQKEYAIQSAKDTYEEDLAEFKLNNALKYDEAVANEEKIRKMIQGNAMNAGLSSAKETLNKSNIWDSNKLFGNEYLLKNSSATAAIDYDKIGDELVSALKKANLQVVLNGKVIGNIIDKQVNSSLR